jgi:hypothetical protein
MSLTLFKPKAEPGHIPADLSGRLLYLQGFGKPRLHSHDDGSWSAHIAMHVASAGASFDVRSEFDCRTPDAAMDQLLSRVAETLGKLGVKL